MSEIQEAGIPQKPTLLKGITGFLEHLDKKRYAWQEGKVFAAAGKPENFLTDQQVDVLRQDLALEGILGKREEMDKIAGEVKEKIEDTFKELTPQQKSILSPNRVFCIKKEDLGKFREVFVGLDKLRKPTPQEKVNFEFRGAAGLYGIIAIAEVPPEDREAFYTLIGFKAAESQGIDLDDATDQNKETVDNLIKHRQQVTICHEWIHTTDQFFSRKGWAKLHRVGELVTAYLAYKIMSPNLDTASLVQFSGDVLDTSPFQLELGEYIVNKLGGIERMTQIMQRGKATNQEKAFLQKAEDLIVKKLKK